MLPLYQFQLVTKFYLLNTERFKLQINNPSIPKFSWSLRCIPRKWKRVTAARRHVAWGGSESWKLSRRPCPHRLGGHEGMKVEINRRSGTEKVPWSAYPWTPTTSWLSEFPLPLSCTLAHIFWDSKQTIVLCVGPTELSTENWLAVKRRAPEVAWSCPVLDW